MEIGATTSVRNVWSVYQTPSHPEKPPPISREPVRIRHPGYKDACNTLFKFWPLDSGGVHHETVRIACSFLVDNAWDSYLSIDQGGQHPVDAGPDGVLMCKSYYFHLPDQSRSDSHECDATLK
jgi:hypothetical protein